MMTFRQHEIGHGILVMWDDDGRGIYWRQPECRAWMPLRFKPDPKSTGHVLAAGDLENTDKLTIVGSLLCPKGCGKHGHITNGRWVPA